MKKFIPLLLLLVSTGLLGQINLGMDNGPSPWRVGGGLGLNLGSNDYLGIRVAPFVGYQLMPSLEAGATVGYQFTKTRYIKRHFFNGGPYLNFYPIPSFFARAQYEFYSGNSTLKSTGNKTSFTENALWVGGGYRTVGRVQFYAGLMYNVLHKSDSWISDDGLRPIVGASIGL